MKYDTMVTKYMLARMWRCELLCGDVQHFLKIQENHTHTQSQDSQPPS